MPVAKITRSLVVVTVLVLGSFFVAYAGPSDNLDGYAWSSNIGWISFNCENTDCIDSNYGVSLGQNQGGFRYFSGYAWSSNIGWISFNAGDVTGCPGGGNCDPRVNTTTNMAEGWAKALAGDNDETDGWDGWVKLSGLTTNDEPYGVELSENRYFHGWAWAGEHGGNGNPNGVIGWISFNCEDRGVCDASDYKVQFKNVTITVTKTGNGLVLSSEDPALINCGGDCSGEYLVGDEVTLTAYPDDGFAFAGWTNCFPANTAQCSTTADHNKVVHASFTPVNLYTGVRFVDAPPGNMIQDGEGGSVTETAHSISCSDGECGYTVSPGDQVDLMANAAAGYKFVQWFNPDGQTPCANALSNPCSFVKGDSLETAKAEFRKTECNNSREDEDPPVLDGIDEADPQCDGIDDDSESQNGSFSQNCPFDGAGACPACNDGVDNDNDGFRDYRGFCVGAPGAANESECSDANDPPDNPTTWYPADPGCSGSRYRTTEGGLDNRVKEF